MHVYELLSLIIQISRKKTSKQEDSNIKSNELLKGFSLCAMMSIVGSTCITFMHTKYKLTNLPTFLYHLVNGTCINE